MPSQQTADAIEQLAQLVAEGEAVATTLIVVEFLSLLRSLRVRKRMSAEEESTARTLMFRTVTVIDSPAELLDRAWEIAVRLGQSDVFDAYGYAASEWLDAEFWTSDDRFANAATSAGLVRIRLAG